MTKGRMTTQPCEAHGCVNDADCAFREVMAGALSRMRATIQTAMPRCMHLYWRFNRGLTPRVGAFVIDHERPAFRFPHTYVRARPPAGGRLHAGGHALSAAADH